MPGKYLSDFNETRGRKSGVGKYRTVLRYIESASLADEVSVLVLDFR